MTGLSTEQPSPLPASECLCFHLRVINFFHGLADMYTYTGRSIKRDTRGDFGTVKDTNGVGHAL